jgi:ABC-2 type transport system permease protein
VTEFSVPRGARLFFVGGLLSFRALFGWLNPWIYVPSFLLVPVAQILLFAYIGRSAGVADDAFYVIGNAVQYSVIPCVFAMGFTISGERYAQTLGLVLSSPAPRVPLFLGRSLPVICNGWLTSMFSLVIGGALLGVAFSPSALLGIATVVAVGMVSCTGLGMVLAAVDLQVREAAVFNNIVFGFLLLLTGANVALSALPGWAEPVGRVLPLTHAIEACRELAAGAGLSDVSGLMLRELLIGVVLFVVGLVMMRLIEQSSRRRATLEML